VDGEEFDAPAAEVEEAGGVRAYQIQRASENRLKRASEALAEAKRVQASIAQWAVQHQQPQKPQETDEQFIASKIDIIRFGTPEEAAKAQLEIAQRLNKPVDQNAIIDRAADKIRHDQAVAEFDREFVDISSNPLLLKLAVAMRSERIAQVNGPIDWNSFYRTIGNEIRGVAGKPSQAPAAPATSGNPSQSPSEKEARKASIVNLPTAAARASLPEAEKQLSPEEARKEAILQMKKARGQQTG
jgi:hypothetical protein